jgi:hypothetical protein
LPVTGEPCDAADVRRALALVLGVALAAPIVPAASESSAAPAAKAKRAKKPTRAGKKRKAASAKRRDARSRARASTEERERSRPALLVPVARAITCPADMVAVAGRVCVDRFEIAIVDRESGAAWSPFYTPDLGRAREVVSFYEALRGRAAPGSVDASTDLPALPTFSVAPRAVSVRAAMPQGYLSADQADAACAAAGKRLCTEAEWVTACRGQAQREFPYGDRYEQGTCNVFREDHPSSILHGNPARYHDDPRNGLLVVADRPLLLETGGSPRCASRWGDDAIFDMVGNLDEWVADEQGAFLGGFYSRGSKSGCFAKVTAHPRRYSDYSTGARCCKDPT